MAEFDPKTVRDVSVAVYSMRLEASHPGAVARMLAEDADDGKKLRERAASYDPLTRCYLRAREGA